MTLFFVPAGSFQMGANENDPDAAAAELPAHEVRLDGFWLDETEVSNAQYQRCVDAGACRKSGYANDTAYNQRDYPAVGIAWGDAAQYCVWAGGRLPTEAEWEYAAKGPEGFRYPWGDTFDGHLLNFCDANCDEIWADKSVDDGFQHSAPVGRFPAGASWAGGLDMAGNVWEWTGDGCAHYGPDPQSNPSGPQDGNCKIIRGGAWASPADGVRTSFRLISAEIGPEIRHPNIGFRCVIPEKQGIEGATEMSLDPISVPQGNPPTIDGTISSDEWSQAASEMFAEGSQLFLLQNGEFLYVGIRAGQPGMIAGNIYMLQGDEILVLHASAALGTAIYQKADSGWQKIQDFTWRCRHASNSQAAQAERAEFLQEENWVAANGLMGTPHELEYQIKIPAGDFRLAAVYIQASPPYQKTPWPVGLTDDTILPTPGGLPGMSHFSPQQWVKLNFTGN
jgi:formylglycine-generating enzyme required for sulfatase activity